MKIEEFEKELQEIDKDLSIRPNSPHKVFPELEKLASVNYRGESICTIPNYEIFDTPNSGYGVDAMGDGRFFMHRTRPQTLEIVKAKLNQLQDDPEYASAFFGTGDYSPTELKKAVEPGLEIADEVSADIITIENQSLIKKPTLK